MGVESLGVACRKVITAVLTGGVAALAGCSSDGESDTGATDTPVPGTESKGT